MTAGLIVKPFIVAVGGHGEWTYYTRTRGHALAKAWRDFAECRDVTFGQFLAQSNAYSGVGSDRFGEPLTICGEPAFYIRHDSQYIHFVRPDSDVILCSHPLDVEPPEARRGTPYYQEQPR